MISKIIEEKDIQQAKKYIGDSDRIVIVTHVSPDGDAIGSSLALCCFLLEMGKQVNVVVPNDFPEFLKWMHGAKDIVVHEKHPALAAETIAGAELIFCVDFNIPKRIDKLAPLVLNAKAKKVMIDHHLYPGDFCDVTMSYPQMSSTSEMIFRFICRMSFFDLLTQTVAECIYTGMMTDTGAFTYNSNNPEIYAIIGELLKKGINKDEIYAKVYNTQTLDRVRFMGYILYERMKIYPEYKTALIVITEREKKEFKFRKGDTEGFVNLPLSIADVVFSVLMREDKEMVKISFRSTGDFPVNRFAADHFSGGGHLNAAGGEYYGSLADAIAIFEKALPTCSPETNVKK
jgi:phosphoesterase RecJ-like protein